MARSVNRARRRYAIAAAAPVVAAFAVLYAWSVPADPATKIMLAAVFAWPAMFWLLASWLLVHHWWRGAGARLSTMDTAGQLLAATVATLPEPRQRWGEAMLGELDQVRGRLARWRFALSCVRAALTLPPPASRLALALAAGLAAVAVAGAQRYVDDALAGLGVFAVSLVAFVGVMAILAIARSWRIRSASPAATVLVTGAVVAAIVATAVFLQRHPAAAEGLSPERAIILAFVFAGCLWLAVAPPRRWAGSRLASHLGAGAAVGFIVGTLAIGLLGIEGLVPLYLLFAPMLIFAVPAAIAAAKARSLHAGIQAGIWTAITLMPLSWAVGLVNLLREYDATGQWRFAGDLSDAGFNLGFSFMLFLAIPLIGFPFAVFGALAGAQNRGTAP